MISTLTGSPDSIIKIPYSDKEPYAPFVDIYCDEVFSVTYGKIVFVGSDGQHNMVTVKVNDNEILRYGHLTGYEFRAGTPIEPGIRLCKADRWVRFEYCTSWKGDSKFPVHVGKFCYFKQDPTDIIEGRYLPAVLSSIEREFRTVYTSNVEFTNDIQKTEFGDNKSGS